MGIFDTLADAVFPPTCTGCSKNGTWLCKNCKTKLQPTIPECISCRRLSPNYKTHENCGSPIDRTIIAWRYSDISRSVVKRFKYQMSYVSIKPVLDELAKIIERELCDYEGTVVPVPLHAQRKRDRGFNQSEIIGKSIGKNMNTHLVKRVRYTDSQAKKNEDERRTNITGAFKVVGEIPREVLLVDDVITTGSTIEELAKTIRKERKDVLITAFALFRPPVGKV